MTQHTVPLAGVIGQPIGHSRSPLMHKHWLRRYGLRGDYVPLDVAPENLRTVLKTLPQMGFVGANVTLPHKASALAIADHVSDQARLIGAANTLTFAADGTIYADNTDGYGFISNIRTGAPSWKPAAGPALVLGAGGAARAIIVALLDAGTPLIMLCNRTRQSAEVLRDEFGPRIKVVDWAQTSMAVADATILVNTTSLGMTGQPALTLSLDNLHAETVVSDIVYAPLQTDLLIGASARGCVTVDGLGMLLHQGVPGFERWFGKRPVVDEALRQAVLA